jgi:hypothetical protein
MTEARTTRGYSFPKFVTIVGWHTPMMWGWLIFFNTYSGKIVIDGKFPERCGEDQHPNA